MKKIHIIFLLLSLLFSSSILSQNKQCSSTKLISKIDSISKENKLENGVVVVAEITTFMDDVQTSTKRITHRGRFQFDDPFLIIDEKYFNINNLLYFEIKSDYIRFFFQH